MEVDTLGETAIVDILKSNQILVKTSFEIHLFDSSTQKSLHWGHAQQKCSSEFYYISKQLIFIQEVNNLEIVTFLCTFFFCL